MAVAQFGEALAQQQADPGDMIDEAGREDDVEHGVADRHRERIAAEGGAVNADRHAARGVGGGEARAHRETAADALGDGHDVGMNPGVFIGEQAPGAPDAGLDLVEDQQQRVLVAQGAQPAQEGRRHDPHAALALDRFDEDRPGAGPDRRLDGVEVAERNLVEAVDLRAEAFDIFGLPARRDRRQRPAMEGAFEGQHAVALGMAPGRLALARHLDRRLVGLGARIGEEHEVGEGRLGEAGGEPLAPGIWNRLELCQSLAPCSASAATRCGCE